MALSKLRVPRHLAPPLTRSQATTGTHWWWALGRKMALAWAPLPRTTLLRTLEQVSGLWTAQTRTDTRGGAAFIFQRTGTTWTQTEYLKASNRKRGGAGAGCRAAADRVPGQRVPRTHSGGR